MCLCAVRYSGGFRFDSVCFLKQSAKKRVLFDWISHGFKDRVYNVAVLVLAHLSDAQLNGKHEAVSFGQRVLPPQR